MGSCLSRNKAVAPNKVRPEFDEEKDYLGNRGYSKTLKNDGVELFAYFWPANPDVPLKGIIQLAHGSAAYTCFDYLNFKGTGQPNVYDGSWVETFNNAGFSVCGVDHQGYGRSKGVRPVGKKFHTHVDNVLALAKDVTENGGPSFPSGLPYFLVGHGMGGLVATLACVKEPERFAGLVLLSPQLSMDGSEKRSGSMRLGIKSRPKSDDGAASTSSEHPVPWITEAWAADPFVCDGGMRTSKQKEDLAAPTAQLAAEGGMEAVALPLLIFQSERDTYADPEGARKLHERAGSSDKTLRMLSDQWHVLTKEDGWESLLSETTAWLGARATNSGALTRGLGDAAAEAPQTEAEGAAAAAAAAETPAEAAEAPAPAVMQEEQEEKKDEEMTDAEAAAAPEAEQEAEEQQPLERSSAPVLPRSMSMLERMPEHEPLTAGPPGVEPGSNMPMRRYSFSGGRVPRAVPGDTTPTPSATNLLGPLPPLAPLGQRRQLSTLPAELTGYQVRGRLPPLPPLAPLLDRKPIG